VEFDDERLAGTTDAAEAGPVGSKVGDSSGFVATGTADWSARSSSRIMSRRSSLEIGKNDWGAEVGRSLGFVVVDILEVYGAARRPWPRGARTLLEPRWGGITEIEEGRLKQKPYCNETVIGNTSSSSLSKLHQH
jgi:hypothetical protein